MDEGLQKLLGTQAAMIIVLTALVSTHHEYDQLQLQLARLYESPAGEGFLTTLSDPARSAAAAVVEHFQQIKEVPGEIDPFGSLGIRRS